MNESAPAPSPEKPGKSKRKRLIFACSVTLGVLLLVGIAGAALFLSPWREIPPVTPPIEDFVVQSKLFRRFYKEFSDRKNIPERSTLKLTPGEVNSLFRVAANFQGKELPFPVRYYRPAFSGKGVFSLTIPLRTWAGAVYTDAAFTVAKGPEGLKVTPVSLKVGRVPLPCGSEGGIAAGLIGSQIAEAAKDPNYTLFDQAVESISFDGEHLVVVYRPGKLLELISL